LNVFIVRFSCRTALCAEGALPDDFDAAADAASDKPSLMST
jgi:hypothetical protein